LMAAISDEILERMSLRRRRGKSRLAADRAGDATRSLPARTRERRVRAGKSARQEAGRLRKKMGRGGDVLCELVAVDDLGGLALDALHGLCGGGGGGHGKGATGSGG
jgi:hypothetical protein